ncbi:hypothetical protein N9H39_06470 [Gammaproteobacteria bacterium]|nr:hypothetical protein [Gammaproteobacteria bacterium]
MAQNDKPIIDINIEENAFSEMAKNSRAGMFVQQPSSEVLPRLTALCVGHNK